MATWSFIRHLTMIAVDNYWLETLECNVLMIFLKDLNRDRDKKI